MHRQTLWLVDNQQHVIFVQYSILYVFPVLRSGKPGCPAGRSHRRDTHDIARIQAALGLHPALVHPHLAFTQDTVYPGPGNAFQFAQQVIIDALPVVLFTDGNKANPGGNRVSHGILPVVIDASV
jgi:hypothetical protein